MTFRKLPCRLLALGFGIALTAFFAVCADATDALYYNTGTISTPPQVDAITFSNSGSWNIYTAPTPYQTANTLNYYNSGSMTGNNGWDFEFFTSSGFVQSSATFTNNNTGVITATDYAYILGGQYVNFGSFLLVNATNVSNQGKMYTGSGGKLQISGVNVSLNRGLLYVFPVTNGIGTSGTLTSSHFTGDVGVYDQAWDTGSNAVFHPEINFHISSPFTNGLTQSGFTLTNLSYAISNGVTTTNVNVKVPANIIVATSYFTNGVGNVTNVYLATTVTNPYPALLGAITTRAPDVIVNASEPCSSTLSPFNSLYLGYLANNYLSASANSTNLAYYAFAATNGIVSAPNAASPAGTNFVTGFADWTNYVAIGTITNAAAKQIRVPTNMILQVVYVRVADTNLTPTVQFTPSSYSSNYAFTASVLLTAKIANAVSGSSDFAQLCLSDKMLSDTNSGLATNTQPNLLSGCTDPTCRPANYVLSRSILSDYSNGKPGFGTPTNDILWDATNLVQIIMTNLNPGLPSLPGMTGYYTVASPAPTFTAYAATVENFVSGAPASLSQSPTNIPGTVRVYATNLDLTSAKLRAEGGLIVSAKNLISSSNAVVDCQYLSYDLGATNGYLHFQNLAKTNANRFSGTLSVCSVTWSNTVFQQIDPSTTNIFPVTLYVMLVDASQLSLTTPVKVYDLQLHATNIQVSDQIILEQSLLLDGLSFTLDKTAGLNLDPSGALTTWGNSYMPTLRYFTNNGTISVFNNANFGSDGSTNLATFVNTGTISSDGQSINADFLNLTGTNNAGSAGDFTVYCRTGVVSGANITAGANYNFSGGSLNFGNSTNKAGQSLSLSAVNLLTDNGSPNYFGCQNGFSLLLKPASGDLLASTIQSHIVGGALVNHTWAGQDYGPSYAGFLNNVSLGTLKLTVTDTNLNPTFNFVGTGSQNALYVNVLDVTNLGPSFLNYLQIADNLKIYYNQAIGDASLTSASAASPGLLNGHLIWMGSTNATTNIVFGASSQPLSPAGFKLSANGVFFPTGLAASNIIVLSSTNLLLPLTNWTPIYTGTPPFTFTDTTVSNRPAKFYRAMQGW